MKKATFFLFLFSCATLAQAQLTVNSGGYVGIRGNASPNYGLGAYSTGGKTAIYGQTTHSGSYASYGVIGESTPSYSTYTLGRCYGVLGKAGASSLSFGVMGVLKGTNTVGAAIYGSAYEDYGHAMDSRYAGYFAGNVLVTGSISGTLLSYSPGLTPSNVGTRIATLPNVAGLLTGLDAKSYYPTANRCGLSFNDDSCTYMDTAEKQVLTKQHYCLDAEQLEEVFPDLVYENEDGSKSINYVEMVPILVQAINELKAEITELKGGDAKPQTRAMSGEGETKDMAILSMGENKPNPFSATTSIHVSIPETVQKAFIYVYDLTGKKVQQLDITARGKQNVQINATALNDGMYLYSLIADGKVVQTRRMIVEK